MTVGDVEHARRCCELAVYASALRNKKIVKPAAVFIESLTFPVPEGFDYDDLLEGVNEELRRYRTKLRASACKRPPWAAERVIRITDM